jgi:hypothetical protein
MPFPPSLVSTAADPTDDGAAVFRRVLQGLPGVLRPGGWAQLLASSIGDDGGPFLPRQLEDHARELGLRIVITVPARISLAPDSPLVGMLATGCAAAGGLDEAVVRDRLAAHLAARGVNYLYSMALTLHAAERATTTQMDHFRSAGGFWFR